MSGQGRAERIKQATNPIAHLPQELYPLRSLLWGRENVITELQILLFNTGSIEASIRVGLESGKEGVQVCGARNRFGVSVKSSIIDNHPLKGPLPHHQYAQS